MSRACIDTERRGDDQVLAFVIGDAVSEQRLGRINANTIADAASTPTPFDRDVAPHRRPVRERANRRSIALSGGTRA